MRAALIGTGAIARQHLGALNAAPGVEIAGVCDLSAVAARAAADRFGAARWFTDHREMLEATRPDVVHVTTPPQSHVALAGDALEAGAHVIVEKPAAIAPDEVREMVERARAAGRWLVEDYNYLFNGPVRGAAEALEAGELGELVHVEVTLALDAAAPFLDAPDHPALKLPGGMIGDFLPHLASLAHRFAGPHEALSTLWLRRDPDSPLESDELRALVRGARATASLTFSSHAQPSLFLVRLHGTEGRATASLFVDRLTVERARPDMRKLESVVNGVLESRDALRSAFAGPAAKVAGGPGSYAGLWELVRRTYAALAAGGPPPVGHDDVLEANALRFALLDEADRL